MTIHGRQCDVFCGSESIKTGIMQAEWVVKELGADGGKIGIIMEPLGQEAAMMRTDGNKMDEPTSGLTNKEVEQLYKIVEDLVDQGIAMMFITHKLEEVFRMAHEITMFRDGEFIGTEPIKNVDKDKLISMMVGRKMDEFFHKEFAEIGEMLLSVRDLTLGKKFRNVSFELRRGEVLGVAGLMGPGEQK